MSKLRDARSPRRAAFVEGPEPPTPRPMARRWRTIDHMGVRDPLEDRRCGARSKRTGEPCRKFKVRGAPRCHMHGNGGGWVSQRRRAQAALRQVRALEVAAVERMLESAGIDLGDPEVVERILSQAEE
jgi:hypothetical protein